MFRLPSKGASRNICARAKMIGLQHGPGSIPVIHSPLHGVCNRERFRKESTKRSLLQKPRKSVTEGM